VLRPLASFFSGAVGTLFGSMASIFFAMYLDASGANKQAFRATLSAMLMTLSVARTIGYAAVNELTLDSSSSAPPRFPPWPRPPRRRPHSLRPEPSRVSARRLRGAFLVRRSAAAEMTYPIGLERVPSG